MVTMAFSVAYGNTVVVMTTKYTAVCKQQLPCQPAGGQNTHASMLITITPISELTHTKFLKPNS